MIYVFAIDSKDLNDLHKTLEVSRIKYICEYSDQISYGFLYNSIGLFRKFRYENFSIDLLEFVSDEAFLNQSLTVYSLSLNSVKCLYSDYGKSINEVVFFGIVDFLYQYYLGKYGVIFRKICKIAPGCRKAIIGPMFNGRSNIDIVILIYILGLFPYIKYFIGKQVRKSILLVSPFKIKNDLFSTPINIIDYNIVKKIERNLYGTSNDKKGCVVILGESPTHFDNIHSKSNQELSSDMASRLRLFLKDSFDGELDVWGHPRDPFFSSIVSSGGNYKMIEASDRKWQYEKYIVLHTMLIYSIPSDSQVEFVTFQDGGIRDVAFIKYANNNDVKISII